MVPDWDHMGIFPSDHYQSEDDFLNAYDESEGRESWTFNNGWAAKKQAQKEGKQVPQTTYHEVTEKEKWDWVRAVQPGNARR